MNMECPGPRDLEGPEAGPFPRRVFSVSTGSLPVALGGPRQGLRRPPAPRVAEQFCGTQAGLRVGSRSLRCWGGSLAQVSGGPGGPGRGRSTRSIFPSLSLCSAGLCTSRCRPHPCVPAAQPQQEGPSPVLERTPAVLGPRGHPHTVTWGLTWVCVPGPVGGRGRRGSVADGPLRALGAVGQQPPRGRVEAAGSLHARLSAGHSGDPGAREMEPLPLGHTRLREGQRALRTKAQRRGSGDGLVEQGRAPNGRSKGGAGQVPGRDLPCGLLWASASSSARRERALVKTPHGDGLGRARQGGGWSRGPVSAGTCVAFLFPLQTQGICSVGAAHRLRCPDPERFRFQVRRTERQEE